MKPSRVIFGLVVTNVALLAVVMWQGRQLKALGKGEFAGPLPQAGTQVASPSASARPVDSKVIPAESSPAHGVRAVLSVARVAVAAVAATGESPVSVAGTVPGTPGRARASSSGPDWPKFDWRKLETEDYRTYVKNLQDIGCPAPTIRDIVSADMLQGYAARRAELVAARYRDFKTQEFNEEADAGFARQRRELDEAMNEAMRELLGPDVTPPSSAGEWNRQIQAQQLAFLPAGQQQAVVEVLTRFGELDLGLPHGISGNRLTPAQAEDANLRLTAFERRRESLLAVLSPDEYERVDMTLSWTAANLRQAMARFQPSESEFRQIFREWRKHDQRVLSFWAQGQPDPGNDHVFAAIEEFLGPERYKHYRATWWK